MTTLEMAEKINLMMDETYSTDMLSAYIDQAREECFEWEYHLIDKPEEPDYEAYDIYVIQAVILGLSLQGAEGETQHSENGILRGFKYSTMTDYIHATIIPYARTL